MIGLEKNWPQHPDGTEIIQIEVRFGLNIPESPYNVLSFDHIDGLGGLISYMLSYVVVINLLSVLNPVIGPLRCWILT